MKSRLLILSAILSLSAAIQISAQKISPIAKAMIDGYTDILKEDPKDYITLYQRAAQYFAMSMNDEALADVVKAIDFTPAKNRDMFIQEYSLLTDICIELKQYENAYKAVDQALKFDPDSYSLLYKKGNVCLYLDRPEEAYRAFSSMQRLKSRSQEAYIGMAKADIMLGRNAEAADLMKEAQNADPNNYITFCRIGDLCIDMKDYDKAAVNYLAAFGLADDTHRPVSALYSLSETQYPAVANALDFAISKSQKPLALQFLKANLALASGNYESAKEVLDIVSASPEAQEASVYTLLAAACFALDKIPEARTAINKSLAITQKPENLAVAAEIALAGADYDAAADYAHRANASGANMAAMQTEAFANLLAGNLPAALAVINEAVMNDPGDPEPLVIRGYINSLNPDTKKASEADYARAAATNPETSRKIAFKAIAQTLNGKKIDGDASIEKLIGNNPDKDAFYWAAVYYSQTGDLDKAAEMRDKAVGAGYGNIHNLKNNELPAVSIYPLIKSGK